MPQERETIERPSALLAALEMLRAGFEGWSLLLSGPMLAAGPRGDGHAVLVLPGFATDDDSTAMLRAFLRTRGYDVHPWRLGWNLDHRTVGVGTERVAARIDAIVTATGRKISLVGWSLGGVIAREVARRVPRAVRQVITIGSPFGGDPRANNASRMYEQFTGHRVDSPAALKRFALGPLPLPMPSSALYSKSDGIAAWQNCIAVSDHQSENIEVHSSHFGMVVNRDVYRIVAERLAQPEGSWSPFARDQSTPP